MKKILFSVFAFFFFQTAGLNAQFLFEVGAGANIGRTQFVNLPFVADPAVNYFAGIRPAFQLGERWNVGVGLQFSQKGHASAANGDFITNGMRLRFIDFLPSAEYRFLSFMSVYGGVNFGYMLTAQWKLQEQWTEPVVDLLNPVDFGVLLGLRLYYQHFYFGAHYNRGLVSLDTRTYTDENGNEIEGTKMLLENVQAGVGYVFGKRKTRE
jgi:hypothetical protein